jgi:hypothetical protein
MVQFRMKGMYHMTFLLDFSFKAWESEQKSWLGDFSPNVGRCTKECGRNRIMKDIV